MITVSEKAKEYIKALMAKENHAPGTFVRVGVKFCALVVRALGILAVLFELPLRFFNLQLVAPLPLLERLVLIGHSSPQATQCQVF